MSAKARATWAILLIDLAIVFVFAVWPLHATNSPNPWGPSSAPSSVSCGSVLSNVWGTLNSKETDRSCDSVVGHRRSLLLALGGGGFVLALLGLELVFATKTRDEESSVDEESARDEAAAQPESADLSEMSSDMLDKLERLGRLRVIGVLTDEEFAAEKAKLLGSR